LTSVSQELWQHAFASSYQVLKVDVGPGLVTVMAETRNMTDATRNWSH